MNLYNHEGEELYGSKSGDFAQRVNIFKALGRFIQAMRLFISTELQKKYGDTWERKYFESLLPVQKDSWGKSLQEGVSSINLIDFGNLNGFAISQRKSFFYDFFGKKSNNLPTIFNELAEVRNILAHYLPFDKDKAEKAFLHMIEIAKILNMNELENDIRNLKDESFYERKHIKEIKPKRAKVKNFNKPLLKQRPNIRKVINLILNTTGVHIDRSNVNLSTINSSGSYSVEPNFNRINNDWFLILINTQNKTIYAFNIPANNSVYENFYKRNDKDVYRLTFDVDDLTFTDSLSSESLSRFLEGECRYDDDSLIFN